MTEHSHAPVLRVVGGLHAGAVCAVPDGPFTIGSQLPADVILCDDGVAGLHLIIERYGSDVRLSAKANGVSVEGQALSIDEAVAAALPVDITIGSVTLRCDTEKPDMAPGKATTLTTASWLSRLPFVRRGAHVSFASISAVLGMSLLGGMFQSTSTEAFAPAHPPSAASASHSAMPPMTDEALRERTRQQLEGAHLDGLELSVAAGIVVVSGRLDVSTMPRLHEVELWFDRSFGERAVLVSHVTAQTDVPPVVTLDAVWTGSEPNVVVRGQKYFVGASLPDGSVVRGITARQVVVERAGTRYAIDY